MCDVCDRCDSFFKLFTESFFLAVFFLKTNFNSKLPVTHVTHLWKPHRCSILGFSNLSHILSHTRHT